MLTKLTSLVSSVFIFVSSCIAPICSVEANVYTGHAAILVDANSGKIMYEHHSRDINYPASLTKMMTIYIALNHIVEKRANFTDLVTISVNASKRPSLKVGFNPGDRVMLYDLVVSTAIHSANDSATAIAEYIGGTEDRFVTTMNSVAREIGMTNTNFTNPHGLHDESQYSTAQDMAKLSMALWRNFRIFFDLFSIKSFKIGSKKFYTHNNTVLLEGGRGIKTGYTSKAGYNISSFVSRHGIDLICVLMGVKSSKVRDGFIRKLFDYVFNWIEREQKSTLVITPSGTPASQGGNHRQTSSRTTYP